MKRLTNILLVILCLFLMACAKEPEPHRCVNIFEQWKMHKDTGNTGAFFPLNKNEGLFFILNSEVALHEVGHYVDMKRGFPSSTPSFQDAIDEYLASPGSKDAKLLEEIEQGTSEIYAELYRYSLVDDLPTMFEEFFDQ